jgi:dihydroorotase
LLIRGGEIIDEGGRRRGDVLVENGVITEVGEAISAPAGVLELDAAGAVVAPGLVDLHTHLREPGREEAETVMTGSRAAARGGFTAVVAMPNTDPVMDSAAVVRQVQGLGAQALCDVYPSAAITVGRKGEALTPMAELAELGVRIFTDDGDGVQNARLMRRAMEYATGLSADVVLAQHCEVDALADGGHMNEGAWSSRLGVPGVPAEAEDLMVARDIALARLAGAPVHFQHLSTVGSVELVRRAKADGLAITAEACPHHFTLTDESVAGYDPIFKVNPPLRTAEDVAGVRAGLADGTFDAIATDHAPHSAEVKELPFDQAPPGMVGLETALALALTELQLDVETVLGLLSWRPARIARVAPEHGGPVAPDSPAHLCVIDLDRQWTVDPADTVGRSHNNPYAGRRVRGRVRHTVLRGEPVVVDGEPQR